MVVFRHARKEHAEAEAISNGGLLVRLARLLQFRLLPAILNESRSYWSARYWLGGTSGAGSYGEAALYKAQFINEFVRAYGIQRVIEFGCGDGNQVSFLSCPKYTGLDVSRNALLRCTQKFAADLTKSFFIYDPLCFKDDTNMFQGDLAISLDVIYHLIEDNIFELYMQHLFSASSRFVIIYSTNTAQRGSRRFSHVFHRNFTPWVEDNLPQWRLVGEQVQADPRAVSDPAVRFFIFEKSPKEADT